MRYVQIEDGGRSPLCACEMHRIRLRIVDLAPRFRTVYLTLVEEYGRRDAPSFLESSRSTDLFAAVEFLSASHDFAS